MWKINETKEVLKTPIFSVQKTEKISPKGDKGNFVSIKSPNWVKAIIYDIDSDKYLLCKEFRQGVNDYVYEFPSGTVEDGETPEKAVIREVKEETGYQDAEISQTFMREKNPNPAFMTNLMSIFKVVVKGKPANKKLDEFEDLSVIEVDKDEIPYYIERNNNKGGVIDWLVTKIICG